MKPHLVIKTHIPSQSPIAVTQTGPKEFTVSCGAEERECLAYKEAAHEYGELVFLSLYDAVEIKGEEK